MGGQAGGRKEEGADTALKTKTPHVNVGNKDAKFSGSIACQRPPQ